VALPMTYEDPVESQPRPVPQMTDAIDRTKLPFLKRDFQPEKPVDRDFKVTLYTELEKGFNIQVTCNGLHDIVVITYVGDGPGTRWNEIYEDRQIKPNDRLLEVNGKTSSNDMVDELRASSVAALKLRRPVSKRIRMPRPANRPMGMACLPFDEETVWVDRVVTDGIIPEWNSQNLVSQVAPSTRILEVNGVKGSAEALLEEIKTCSGVIDIVVESHGPQTVNPEEPAGQGWAERNQRALTSL